MRFLRNLKYLALVMLASLLAIRCLQNEVVEVDVVSLEADSTLMSFNKVKITVLDSNQGLLQVLFEDSVASLTDLSRLRLATPYRGRIVIRIEGEKDGKPAYLELREFNLTTRQLSVSKVIFDPTARISRPPLLSGLPSAAELFVGDTLKVTATARDSDGVLAFYAWSFEDGYRPDTVLLGDTSASIPGVHAYRISGAFEAVLRVSDGMSTVQATIVVTVKSRATGTPLEALAGEDAIVATDSLVTVRGAARGGQGPVVKYEWRFGAGSFIETASGDTAILMPDTVGAYPAILKVTDSSGQSDTDTLMLNVVASANARLAALRLGQGAELDPAFKPETEIYTASVPWETRRIALSAAVQHPAAQVKVALAYLKAGDSAWTDLAVGENTLEAIVTSQSGMQKKYQIKVFRRKNTNAKLASLEAIGIPLSPDFHPDSTAYSASVANDVLTLALKAAPQDSGAGLRLFAEGSKDTLGLAPNTASAAQALEVGTRAFEVWVIAADGSTRRMYRVAVTRQASPNATLLNLVPSVGTLKPTFSPGISEYFDTVGNAVAQMTLRAVATSDKAKLYQAGGQVASGDDGPVAGLPVGDTTFAITVRSEAGDTNVYRVRVHRKSNDATLKSLVSTAGGPKGFFPGTETYADTVSSEVDSVRLTPTSDHMLATVAVQGQQTPYKTASARIGLKDGVNRIEVKVTAEDGNTRTYVWNLYRISANTTLKGIEPSSGKLGKMFSPNVFFYKDTVPEATGKFSVRPFSSDSSAKIFWKGMPATSGKWTDSVPLAEGLQSVKLKVVAENGDSAIYSFSLYRTSANGRLSALSISPGSLNPAFSGNILQYSDTVNNDTAAVLITGALQNNKSTIVKIGDQTISQKSLSNLVHLKEGMDPVVITVRDEEGNQTTYHLNITRLFHPASLSSLFITRGKMIPSFSFNQLTYQDTVSYKDFRVQLAAECAYPGCAITASFPPNNIPIPISPDTSGNPPFNLVGGPNPFTITVTSGNASRAYLLNVYRKRGFAKNFGGGANGFVTSLYTQQDGGFATLGQIENGSRLSDLYLVKTTHHGDSIWFKTYGTPFRDHPITMKALPDNSLIILGYSSSVSGSYFLTRTDAAFDPIWTKTVSGFDAQDLIVTTDGGYLISGSLHATGNPTYHSEAVLMKLDANGNLSWQKSWYLGNTQFGSTSWAVREAPDAGYVLAGTVFPDAGSFGLLLRTNSSGDTLWTRKFGGLNGSRDEFRGMEITLDGGILAGGSRVVGGSSNAWVIRTDPSGKESWSRVMANPGFTPSSLVKSNNDGCVLAGSVSVGGKKAAGYLLSLNPNGDVALEKYFESAAEHVDFRHIFPIGNGYVITGTPPYTFVRTDLNGQFD